MRAYSAFFAIVSLALSATACKKDADEKKNEPGTTELHAAAIAPATAAPPAAAPPAAKDSVAATAPATAKGPFTVTSKGHARVYREACLTSIGTPWTIMIPKKKGAKACDVDGEDDFAVSFDVHPCGEKAEKCALPAPGSSVKGKMDVEGGFTGDVTMTVLRHERPYLVVSVDGPIGADSASGELRILVSTDGEMLVEPSSWKGSAQKADEPAKPTSTKCGAGKHYDMISKKCRPFGECPEGYEWNEPMATCLDRRGM